MIRTLPLGAVALATMATSLVAADLPSHRMPRMYIPPPIPAFSWTGLYIGIDGGYGVGAHSDQLTVPGNSPTGLRPSGTFGGGQAGYNDQLSQIVVGVETDIQGSGIGVNTADNNFGNDESSRLRYFGTARGRVGYMFDRALIYGTSGVAYGHMTNDLIGAALAGGPYGISRTSVGYAVGGGVEYAMTDVWGVKLEYLYLNLGKNAPINAAGVSPAALPTPAIVRDDAYHTVRAGVNYKFDVPGLTPVVARY